MWRPRPEPPDPVWSGPEMVDTGRSGGRTGTAANAPPVDTDLRELIECALRTADRHRAAVRESGRTWSYQALASASGRLAERLAGGDGTVAVVLPRGADAIVATVACIRAGRPFLPLQPDTDARATAADAAVTAVVSDGRTPAWWDGAPIHTVPVHTVPIHTVPGDTSPERLPDRFPGAARRAAGACGYLLTTSGTAGRPKLVRGSAGGLARYLQWQRRALALDGSDVLSNTADPWFDFSFKETLGGLVAGATVAVVEPPALTSGAALLGWLATHGPTTVCLLPSRLAAVVAAMERDDTARRAVLRRLRLMLVSGEAFPATLLERWRSVAPTPTVLNLYGPTESTVIKLCNVLPPGAVVDTPTVPVGRPIPGTSIQLVPTETDGVGELYLISDDLALGYVRSEGGSTRFDREPGGHTRLRTGDLARLTADGAVELVGRVDDVVKRRGVKVPLPAIDAAALRAPRIHAAAAVACPGAGGDDRIVLFCGVDGGPDAVSVRDVRLALLDRLEPGHLPDQIRFLTALPLDARAKVDRAALRELGTHPGDR